MAGFFPASQGFTSNFHILYQQNECTLFAMHRFPVADCGFNMICKCPPATDFYSLIDSAAYWAFRCAGCALLNLGEDAALLALMFC